MSHLNIMTTSPAGIRSCASESVCFKLSGNPKIDRGVIATLRLAEQRLKARDSPELLIPVYIASAIRE